MFRRMISALRRARYRQRIAVYRALYLHGPFVKSEARRIASAINFSQTKAARMIRASRGK